MIVGITGYAQSGKDTAAGFLVAERGFKRLAFADILRESLYNLNPIITEGPQSQGLRSETIRVQDIVDRDGWDVAKTRYTEIRQLLQRFGTEVGRELYGENFWVDRVMNQVMADGGQGFGKVVRPGNFVITDVRFPNEERAVHKVGGRLIKIQRPGNKPANTHASEDIERLPVDIVIPNNGSLEEFKAAVFEALGLN